jgi:farnesyl diphosphate synthase
MTPLLLKLSTETKHAVDTIIQPYLTNSDIPEPLRSAMLSSVNNGGKRLRPMLTLACSKLFDVPQTQAIRVGAAIELVHSYSLIHDDLPAMDNAETRRGHPSCWRAYGEATAILAGDSLLPLAFEILSEEKTHPSADVRLQLIKRLSTASGAIGMAGGQMLDLNPQLIDSVERATTMQNLKTGCLISFACEAAAILGNTPPNERDRLRQFGLLLGLAYQIQDDLLDIQGTAAQLGKPTGMDTVKRSIVVLMGVEESKRYLESLETQMHALMASYNDPIFTEIITWVASRTA